MFCRKMIIETLLLAALLVSFSISDSDAINGRHPCATGDCEFDISTNAGYICDVSVTTEGAIGNDPAFSYPYGLILFTVQDDPCDSMNAASAERTSKGAFSPIVTLNFFKSSDHNTPLDLTGLVYRKYGVVANNATSLPHWYDFMYDMVTGAVISSNEVTLYFVDNERGDNELDGAVNVIIDPGGLAMMSTNIPTMSEWGMIIFMVFAGIGSVYYLRRQRRKES